MEILNLNLMAPLYYTRDADSELPEDEVFSGGERLYCFELDEKQRTSFEPDRAEIIGKLLFSGKITEKAEGEPKAELPRGKYLFAQERRILNMDEIIAMAIEIQQEGLWQRRKLSDRLYLRFLHEDGCFVTQLFRPYL